MFARHPLPRNANFAAMPGKCKFQDSWLAKDIYRDWLVKDQQDIHLARCKACCKAIKLQTMGEAALTSHAGGAGHKAAVRQLVEGSIPFFYRSVSLSHAVKMPERLKRSKAWIHFSKINDGSSQCNICQKTIANKGGTTTNLLKHLSSKHGIMHVAKCAYPSSSAPSTGGATDIEPTPDVGAGTSAGNILMINVGEHLNGDSGIKEDEDDKAQVAICLQLDSFDHVRGSERLGLHHSGIANPASHNAAFQEVMYPPVTNVPPAGHPRPARPRPAAPTGAEQRAALEWERRMEVLRCEVELLAGRRRAARQKERAARMKRRYYRAKLLRLGEAAPPCSSSSSEEDL